MDRTKTSVVKSKSSNSAITTKSEPRKNKKTRSNAEIQPLMLKKRGVYVEKKATKVPINHSRGNDSKKQVKQPLIPRASRKRFLNSVLTILSKSTAATQYPDTDETPSNRKCEKVKFRNRVHDGTTDTEYTGKTRHRYRSRVLNEYKNDVENFVVLQSRKDIVHTPSDNSTFKEPEVIKWSEFLPPLVNSKEEIEKSIYESANQGIAKEVLDGIEGREKKVKLCDNNPSPDAKKNDKGLYNFFVDLLETTFSIYNVKPEYTAVPSATSPKVGLEIDETVARKLDIAHHFDDVVKTPSKHFCYLPENNWEDNGLMSYIQTEKSAEQKCSPKSSRRLKTRSFTRDYRKLSPVSYTQSVIPYKQYKKNTKKDLLDTIKEQLRRDFDVFEKPQNLYQALKQIARNKKKSHSSIRFDKPLKTAAGSNDPECVFKRRKVISFSTKASTKKSFEPASDALRSMLNNYSDRSSTIKKALRSELVSDDSVHSLEVYGFDYESMPDKRQDGLLKGVELTYHSSPSGSEQDFNVNEALLKYSASGTSSVQNYINWNRGITSVTKIVKQY